jgi:hypothetical protein
MVELLGSTSAAVRGLGYVVRAPGELVGRTGTRHGFDLVFAQGKSKGVVRVFDKYAMLDDRSLMEFFLAVFDVSPQAAILLAVPKASEIAKEVAGRHGVVIVEGRDAQTILSGLKAALGSR